MSPSRPQCTPRALARDRRGTTALEFAMVGPILLILTSAIIEISLDAYIQGVLDDATFAASRQIKIGAMAGQTNSTSFTQLICNEGGALLYGCSSNLQVYVTSGTSFGQLTRPTISGTQMTTGFSPGGPQQDVLVAVAYANPLVSPWLRAISSGTPFMVAMTAFQNEP